jgi:uncharacterized protein (DUF1330 family)
MHIDPTPSQFQEFKEFPRDTPIQMLNLIKLKVTAAYKEDEGVSGASAYAAYGKESAAIFHRVGGEIIWRGKPESVLIGPSDEEWDIAFIARYPSAKAFLQMVTDPAYQAIVYHRQAAVETSRLIRLGEIEATDSFG